MRAQMKYYLKLYHDAGWRLNDICHQLMMSPCVSRTTSREPTIKQWECLPTTNQTLCLCSPCKIPAIKTQPFTVALQKLKIAQIHFNSTFRISAALKEPDLAVVGVGNKNKNEVISSTSAKYSSQYEPILSFQHFHPGKVKTRLIVIKWKRRIWSDWLHSRGNLHPENGISSVSLTLLIQPLGLCSI